MASPPDSDDEPQGQLDMGDMMKMILEVKKKVSDLESGVKSRDDEISDLKKDVKNRDDEIAKLKKQVQDVQQKQDPTMDKFADKIKGLNEDQKKGEEGKTILENMCDYVRKHPYIVCGAVTAGICTGLLAFYGVPCLCAALGSSKVVVGATASTSAAACHGTGAGAGAAVLLVGDYVNKKTSKEKMQ